MQAATHSISVSVPSASPSEDVRSITTAEQIDLQAAINRAFVCGLKARRNLLRNRLRRTGQQAEVNS